MSSKSSAAELRLLVVRFSSFGDIVHAVGVPAAFSERYSGARVDWLVRSDFVGLLASHPYIKEVIPFPRAAGLVGLIKLSWALASTRNYSHLYDAHNNMRSLIFCSIFRLRKPGVFFARRPKQRLRRWLFFKWRLPVLPRPFRGADSYHSPVAKWGLPSHVPRGQQFYAEAPIAPEISSALAKLPRPLIALAPSAAWEMKRWPPGHWKQLMTLIPEAGFVLLGGPSDAFIASLADAAPDRCLNLAGKLNLEQNATVFQECDLVIANDTGLLQVADQMERRTLALIGPTAFGYPSHLTSRVAEIDLPCKPCSKDGSGRCINSVYQRCLVDLTPQSVAAAAVDLLNSGSKGKS